jgi:hypothetical protein
LPTKTGGDYSGWVNCCQEEYLRFFGGSDARQGAATRKSRKARALTIEGRENTENDARLGKLGFEIGDLKFEI